MNRGERNNNPLNIRRVAGVTWLGQSDTQTDEAFVQFIDPIYGFRAGCRILLAYLREGLETVQGIIDRWAPPNENNSEAYVTAVAAQLGVMPLQRIDVVAKMPSLLRAICMHEEGEVIYTDDQIRQGISLAPATSL
jgi:hypothetical protein